MDVNYKISKFILIYAAKNMNYNNNQNNNNIYAEQICYPGLRRYFYSINNA